MMSITSPAGKRLAKAAHAMRQARFQREYPALKEAFDEAAEAVADELIADRFHKAEGND